MSCGSESGTTPLCPSPHRMVSHSGHSSPAGTPMKGCSFPISSPTRNDPPMRSSSPVEQKKKVCVVQSCFCVHIFAFTTDFCFKNSLTLLSLLSNLNRSDSIHVEPTNKFVLSSFGLEGPMYRDRGSDFVSSVE